jgi:hypothetical protein
MAGWTPPLVSAQRSHSAKIPGDKTPFSPLGHSLGNDPLVYAWGNDDRFRKAPCSRCGEDTYRISYLWCDGRNYLVCAECFKALAAPDIRRAG